MSKKITHIKAKESLKKISWSKGYFEKEEQELKDYIKQQEKQEKLFELYKELAYHTRPIIIDDKYVELQQKIKELENGN